MGFRLAVNAQEPYWCDAQCVPPSCLIVDDNESFLEAARMLLERDGLSVVAVASTYAEPLGLFEILRRPIRRRRASLAGG